MTDETSAAAPEQPKAPQFSIERVYIKDMSFETPRGIEAFKNWTPKIDMDLNTKQASLENDLFEVVLTLTITAKENETDDVYFLVELQQAGIFRAQGLSDEDRRRALSTVAPTTLFPYAREAIDSTVVRANFPPLRLAPINFDALYQAALAKRQEEQMNTQAGSTTVQ